MTSALRSFPAINQPMAPRSQRELDKLSTNALRFLALDTVDQPSLGIPRYRGQVLYVGKIHHPIYAACGLFLSDVVVPPSLSTGVLDSGSGLSNTSSPPSC